jgi:Cytochrome bd terminal oxidase subunit I
VKGLDSFPAQEWPDQVALLYYSYHIMVGLGTIFLAVTAVAGWLLWRGRLYQSRAMLWILMLCLPLPYIANTAGLDHGRGWPPALADLRVAAHAGRRFTASVRRKRMVYAAGVHGDVYGPRHSVSLFGLPRN